MRGGKALSITGKTGYRVGRELCSVLSCSQTLSVLVVVCSPADTLAIDQ